MKTHCITRPVVQSEKVRIAAAPFAYRICRQLGSNGDVFDSNLHGKNREPDDMSSHVLVHFRLVYFSIIFSGLFR